MGLAPSCRPISSSTLNWPPVILKKWPRIRFCNKSFALHSNPKLLLSPCLDRCIAISLYLPYDHTFRTPEEKQLVSRSPASPFTTGLHFFMPGIASGGHVMMQPVRCKGGHAVAVNGDTAAALDELMTADNLQTISEGAYQDSRKTIELYADDRQAIRVLR